MSDLGRWCVMFGPKWPDNRDYSEHISEFLKFVTDSGATRYVPRVECRLIAYEPLKENCLGGPSELCAVFLLVHRFEKTNSDEIVAVSRYSGEQKFFLDANSLNKEWL